MKRRLTEEERREREEKRVEKVIGREVDGATAMNVTLRYLMGGGYPFFGLHGGAILPFFEVLYTDKDFRKWYVSVPHEQIAGHAAEGVADSTGKVGVAVVTSGPALTNLATPCYDAWMDSVPVVYIAGDVPRTLAGSRAFQESPHEMFTFRTKKVFYVDETKNLPRVLAEAFRLAKSGRPGPVLVDVPKDVLTERLTYPEIGLEQNGEKSFVDNAALVELSKRISSAKRPVMYVGGGVRSAEAWDELRQLVDKTGIPVAYTLKGKGAFPDSNQLCLGPIGMHGSATANYAVDGADLLLVLGARFDDRVIGDPKLFAPDAYIAHFDNDPQGIGPKGARQPNLVVNGNLKDSLGILNSIEYVAPELREWYTQISGWKESYPFHTQDGEDIKPQFVIQTLSELLEGRSEDVICATDVGQHQMWTMQHYKASNPRGFLTSGGAGTMGYGLPAALGAKLANPDKPVVVVTGDASYDMLTPTLRLYRRLQPDIKVIVIDNASGDSLYGGMVNQWLRRGSRRARPKAAELPDIVSVAQGYKIPASTIKDPEKVYPSIAQALGMKGPVVLNFKVDPHEEVYPFVPPGKSVKEMEIRGRFDPSRRPY